MTDVPTIVPAWLLLSLLTVPVAAGLSAQAQGSELAPATPQHSQPVEELSACGGYAPLVTSCEAEHVVHDDFGHTCTAGPRYTGTVESRVFFTYDLQSVVTCHYEDGALLDRETDSVGFVIVPWTVSFTCTSFDLGTSSEGGSGAFSCLLVHD